MKPLHKGRYYNTPLLIQSIIDNIKEQLDHNPLLTTISIISPDSLKVSLSIVKILNAGGLKSSLKVGVYQSYINITLPSIEEPRTDEALLLRRILKYRDLVISVMVDSIVINFKRKSSPLMKQIDIDIYTATGCIDPEIGPLIIKHLKEDGFDVTLYIGENKSYVHFNL